MTKRTLLLSILGTALAAADASASPQFLDGAPAYLDGPCVTNGSTVTAVGTYAGYLVDPATAEPKVNQITYAHAVAWELNPCTLPGQSGDTFGFEFFLPPGAQFAISPSTPVRCYIGNGQTGGASSGPCLQYVGTGSHGGAFFGYQSGMAPGWGFEIQVPIKFTQAITNSTLRVTTSSAYGTKDAFSMLTAPFTSSPPPAVQPTPSYYARGDDIALLGSATAGSTLPVAWSNDDGSFTVTAYDVGEFASWAQADRVTRITGDFNADGYQDFALVGGPGWASIPVAMSNQLGGFTVQNYWVGWEFPSWARQPNVKVLAGDFNRDGWTDIALTGGIGWGSVPIAFNNGNGFTIHNDGISNFASWAATPGAKPYVGDFNKDGMTDIALVGGVNWNTVPVAFSYGNGTFAVTNYAVTDWVNYGTDLPGIAYFSRLATQTNTKVVTGDFNKDGYADLALTGGAGWNKIYVALSYGNGQFSMRSVYAPSFAQNATLPNVQLLTGDFNKDGYTDLALTGAANSMQISLAIASGNGYFTDTASLVGGFGIWASQPGARALAGDFNGDGYTDIALTGVSGWGSVPVAMNVGYGFFNIINAPIYGFAGWTTDGGATVAVGRFNY